MKHLHEFQHYDQEFNRILSEVLQFKENPKQACVQLIDSLRLAFNASAPSTLFFANTLVPTSDSGFVLYSYHHAGKYTPKDEAKWERHLIGGKSPVLKIIRSYVTTATDLHVTHAFRRIDLLGKKYRITSRIFNELVRLFGVYDQLFGWHQHHDHVVAFILRSTRPRSFLPDDRDGFRHLIERIATSQELQGLIHPSHFQPYLTGQQRIVRDLVVADMKGDVIAKYLGISKRRTDTLISQVKAAYCITDRRTELSKHYYLRGGTEEEIKNTWEQVVQKYNRKHKRKR